MMIGDVSNYLLRTAFQWGVYEFFGKRILFYKTPGTNLCCPG